LCSRPRSARTISSGSSLVSPRHGPTAHRSGPAEAQTAYGLVSWEPLWRSWAQNNPVPGFVYRWALALEMPSGDPLRVTLPPLEIGESEGFTPEKDIFS